LAKLASIDDVAAMFPLRIVVRLPDLFWSLRSACASWG
jgi:hypothetical protein